jgi:hypothetical protein
MRQLSRHSAFSQTVSASWLRMSAVLRRLFLFDVIDDNKGRLATFGCNRNFKVR